MRIKADRKSNQYLGVDIGGTKCSVTLVTSQGSIVAKEHFLTANCQETVQRLVEIVGAYAAESCQIICGGISCGGPLDTEKGLILSPPNLPDWDAVPIINILSKCSKRPFALENDANACTLAEWNFGAGRGSQDMVFLTFGTGLGAGIIANGQLLRGASGDAGEVGHVRLLQSEDAPLGFSKRGSFEGFCSGRGIAQYIPRNLKDHGVVSAKELAALARSGTAGSEQARTLFTEVGTWLGRGLALLVDILNPQVIVLGSIFMRCEDLLRESMEQSLREEALPTALEACRIVPAQLQEDLGDIAALGVALNLEQKLQREFTNGKFT